MEPASATKEKTGRVAQGLEAHTAIALALGALIYILAVTGTLSVFNRELQRWEQPQAPEMTQISPAAAAAAAQAVFESENPSTTHLYINFPQPDLPRTVITTDTQAFFANADGTAGIKEHFPWTQFLLDLHYYLHLPQILGLTVVGALGAFLLAMSLSGFIAHPRIFRDAFTLRRGEGLLPLVDLHNRLSVWTSPFHISNALTGALLGLASLLAFAIAALRFDGDIGGVFDPVFGGEPAPIETAAPFANIETPIQYMTDVYPQLPPTFLILHDPGTAGQSTSIIAKHSDRLIFGDYYQFDSSGQYKGNVGMSDGTLGQQIIGSVYNVHFGNWGGLAVKLAYSVFGLMLCIIVASGLRIYFLRRRQKKRAAPRLESAWEAIVWGTPLMLGLTLLLALAASLEGLALVLFFWLGLILLVAVASVRSSAHTMRRWLKWATGITLISTVVTHSLRYREFVLADPVLPVTLATLGLAGLLIAWVSRRDPMSPNTATTH
ncbi:MAG: PepSY-associated TM helix domain-containing protein [Pseudomonadota bacterium]